MDYTTTVSQLDLFERAKHIPLSHDVIEAATLGGRPPTTLRKANAAIHVYPVEGQYSLTMRRVFNALLALGHAFIKSKPPDFLSELVESDKALRLEATVADVKTLIGWLRSNNNANLYEALDALQSLKVQWDALATDGTTWKDRAPLIAKWGWSQDNQRIRWAWLPEMASLLFDPAFSFTPLDMELTRQFASKYTLALFENVYRYRNITYTPWRTPHDWKLLVGGTDLYPEFREFKRTALLPALKELRLNPNCPVDVDMEEKRGMHNRIESIRFKVTPRKQRALDMDLPVSDNPVLAAHLGRLGVTAEKARQLVRNFDENYLLAQIAYTDRQKTKPTNAAGFFIKAVEERYRDDLARQEQATLERLAQAREQERRTELESNWRSFRRDESLRWLASTGEDGKASLVRQFLEHHANAVAKRSYRSGGFENRLFRTSFLNWLCEQPHVLYSAEAQDFEMYGRFALGTQQLSEDS